MEEKDLDDQLRNIVSPYAQNKESLKEFKDSTHFIQDLEVNSANLVDIILDVEDEFDIEIDNDSMEGMLTVEDAKNIIRKKMHEK
ncbi:acyl carrier protein [Salegentibacter sp.]|uniref:acyl carrier protein n=1 Tax=Salegentibacter sp. TaxID=1903072 RepID=UPI00356B516A